jgi:hypothetical protein
VQSRCTCGPAADASADNGAGDDSATDDAYDDMATGTARDDTATGTARDDTAISHRGAHDPTGIAGFAAR